MKLVLRVACLLGATISVAAPQQIQSDYFVVNAGLSKDLTAVNPTSVAFSRDGSMVASIDKAGVLQVFNVASGSSLGTAPAHSSGKSVLAFSPYGDTLASWGADQ